MNKLTQLIVVLFFFIFSLTGCEQKQDDGIITLTMAMYTPGGGHQKTMDEIIERFHQHHPNIRVQYELSGFDSYFTKIKTQAASGTLPDLFELNFENFAMFSHGGVLLDLSDYAQKDGISSEVMLGDNFNNFVYQDRLYALTSKVSTVLTFYNKELFERHGLAYPDEHWTWDDEISMGQAITDGRVYGSYAPVTFNEMYKVIAQNGGRFFDEDGNPDIDSEQNIEAVKYMIDKVLEYRIQPSPGVMSGQSPEDMFMNGEIAMLSTGTWMFGLFEQADFEWDVVPNAVHTHNAQHVFADAIAASNRTNHPEAAWQFIKFFTSSPEVAELRVQRNWDLAALDNETSRTQFLEQKTPANRQAVFTALDHGVMPPLTPRFVQLADIIDRELSLVLLGKKNVDEALSQAQQEMSNIVG
ncbi:sugar ABC transporter substrate-binding protein (plasmid) [Photobacterium sp. DA100]|uniref:ABC transporter substrate-binding protein n=1 Tax=Photobacterium sp. DA100 TaxID=3027472 RepID=UPI002478665C|nr:sugar ABC transporter substrate-binding protein [Photobacterium sp. DA100]WEM45527.1 sugar ABC transporter substrate-binding protein [Photobacterium sp. DA100]